MKTLIVLNSHPIQYFAPLYRRINEASSLPVLVWYCSDESIRGKHDKGFGQNVKWDIPLLEGYTSEFLRNYSWKPSIHKGFFGLMNLSIVWRLYREPRSVIMVHGWAYLTHVLAIIFGRLFGHTVCLRAETPLNQEKQKNKVVTFLKHIYLRILFLFVNRFLYVGIQNRDFYLALGIKDNKMGFAPYCVDNDRFRQMAETNDKDYAKRKLGLPESKKIVLYSGKFIEKKRPLDLLLAFSLLPASDALLVFVGEGELRPAMEKFIQENNLQHRVLLTGFINQQEIPLYYRAADVFVMCSGLGETWGLSVNEAMNFGLPVVVSSTCGCAYDLVKDPGNGAIFATGDIDQLSRCINRFLSLDDKERSEVRALNDSLLTVYNYDTIIKELESIAV